MNIQFSRYIERHSNIKFHENPSSGGGGGVEFRANGQTDGRMDGRSPDVTKLTIAFRNFTNASKYQVPSSKTERNSFSDVKSSVLAKLTTQLPPPCAAVRKKKNFTCNPPVSLHDVDRVNFAVYL